MWLYGSNLILVREAQRWSDLHPSPLQLMVRVLYRWPSYRHHSGGMRTSPPWGSEDDINCAQHLFDVPILPSPLAHWDDTKIALTSPLRLATPGESTKSYNPLWCALGLGGIGNEGFDCTS